MEGLRVSDLLLLDAGQVKDLLVTAVDPLLLKRLGKVVAVRINEVSTLAARIEFLKALMEALAEFQDDQNKGENK